jgi:hypothetical protein
MMVARRSAQHGFTLHTASPAPDRGCARSGMHCLVRAGKTNLLTARTAQSRARQNAHRCPGQHDEEVRKARRVDFRRASILDYNVGALWKQGIDGTGTTIALIDGWDDPQINDVIKAFDQKYGLPDPEIQTVYPSDAISLRRRTSARPMPTGNGRVGQLRLV